MIGVASTWSEVTPCNVHIDGLARDVKHGIGEMGANPSSSIRLRYPMAFRWGRRACVTPCRVVN